MNKNTTKTVFIIFLIGIFNGCSALVPDSMLKGIHTHMDSNNDGYLDYNEYLVNSNSNDDVEQEAKEKGMTVEEYQKWDFNRADGNGDGKVTAEELIYLFRK